MTPLTIPLYVAVLAAALLVGVLVVLTLLAREPVGPMLGFLALACVAMVVFGVATRESGALRWPLGIAGAAVVAVGFARSRRQGGRP
ncbi:hypothetical protein [Actinopolymorpha alba]|uniref:hypothetical protein n=1 Tax=Actinopolymorpha alba TaxID=533267 RepID=UPI00036FE4C4|nr:hypothetical protein [Actinopolymorpha alba]